MSPTTSSADDPARERLAGTPRGRSITTIVLALLILPLAGWWFGVKFMELIAVARGEPDGVFAVSPIVNYLLASVGFLLLFVWATLNGMFHDIERPKQQMLETEAWLDQQERS